VKKLAGIPLIDMLALAPKWATHISVQANAPDTFIFESNEYYQAGYEGALDGSCMPQATLGDMCDFALPLSDIAQLIKDEQNEC
jgi:hypothetical protein